jgi:molybdate transport system substrate-binding protein
VPSGGAAIRLAALAAHVAAVAVVATPCLGRAEPARVLGVAAASSLGPAMPELVKAFERGHPGVKVQVTLGASGALFGQLRSGPIDVFLSADRELPQRIVAAKLGGPEVVYAVGRLVLWTPPGSRLSLERNGVKGLTARAAERIAVPNPASSPYGRAAVAAFQAAGIAQAIQGRIVLGQSAAQTAQLAREGGADVALLPAALAAQPELAKGKAVPVPPSLHPRIEHSAVVLARATEPALAGAFLVFLTGREGREILRKHRYELP